MESSEQVAADSLPLKYLDSPSFQEMDINVLDNTHHALQRTQMGQQTRTLIVDLMYRIDLLQERLSVLEQKQPQQPNKKKKNRRKAKEVPKMFECTVSNCLKIYGSQTSLKNHNKIKHGVRTTGKKKINKQQNNNIKTKH